MRTIVSFKRMIKILPWVQKQKYLCQIVVMILVGAGKQSFLAKVEEKYSSWRALWSLANLPNGNLSWLEQNSR